MKRAIAFGLAAALAPMTVAAQSCQPSAADGQLLSGPSTIVAWRAEPQKIEVGRHFSLRLLACTRQQGAFAGTLAVDATMPAHRHGMNYSTTVRSEGGGRFLAEGLLFHMPGDWQIVIDVETGTGRERLVTDVTVD